jgi:16S rRNA (guanine(966)-N(2))-methyltransferase RsmD
VRGALFSSLGDVEGLSFLDSFAGTGAVGIEAISRGARSVSFIEKDVSILKKNLQLLEAGAYRLIEADFLRAKLSGTFDVIFLDPPYGLYPTERLLKHVAAKGLLNPGGRLVYEESIRTPFNAEGTGFTVEKERRYGDTVLYYLIEGLL